VQANRFTNDVIVRCIKARTLAFDGLAFDDDVPRQLQSLQDPRHGPWIQSYVIAQITQPTIRV
jgi:hypothetical protein